MTATVKDSQVTLRLPSEVKDRVERYAQLTGRNKSHVVMEAVADYLAWRTPQIEDLKAAIEAADAGDFASDAEVRSLFARYGKPRPAASKAPRKTTKTSTAPRKRG